MTMQMTRTCLRLPLITIAFGFPPLAAHALSQSEIEARDINDNGVIDRGSELDALMSNLDLLTPAQLTVISRFESGQSSELTVISLVTATQPPPAPHCRSERSFHLQESVGAISLFNPDLVLPSKNGALLSISDDREAGERTWALKGALAWVVTDGSNRCLLLDTADRPQGARLSGFAIAPYLSFDGTGSSINDDTAEIRVGLLSQWQYFGGVFDLQELSVSPYYQTDLDGEAEIYGLSTTWTPYHYESRLNGLQGDLAERFFDWSLVGTVDYQSVEKAGNSGLTEGQDFAWIGLDLGLGYTFADVGEGLRLSAGVSAHYDVINDQDAVMYNAAVRLALSEDRRAFLELRYQNGTAAKTLREVDETTLNFRFVY